MSSQAMLDQLRAAFTYRLVSALNTNNAALIAGRPAKLFCITGWNAATVSYLKIYDKVTAPASTDTPRHTEYLAASQKFVIAFPVGLEFQAGLGIRIVTGSADNDDTAVAAAAVLALNMDYL